MAAFFVISGLAVLSAIILIGTRIWRGVADFEEQVVLGLLMPIGFILGFPATLYVVDLVTG